MLAYLTVARRLPFLSRRHAPPHRAAAEDRRRRSALVGGFLDAAGGGGWGAIVTSNLLVQGSNPRKTIGTVNTAEFFLTVTISATFIATLGWPAFTDCQRCGLLIGGVLRRTVRRVDRQAVNADRC